MSAQQNPGRYCKCGCGRSLADMGPTAVWARGCSSKIARSREYKQKWEAKRRVNLRAGMYPTTVRHSAEERIIAAERERIHCKWCCDDPSNRSPHREADHETHGGYESSFVGFVLNGVWRCRVCWKRYADPEPIERGSLYHSPAAMAVDLSDMYGYQPAVLSQGDVSLSYPKAKAKTK